MMMATILDQDHVAFGLSCSNKKQLFQLMAEQIAPAIGVASHQILDVLWEREQLGSTGVGHGIAIPHGKISGLQGVHGFFARLATPLDFASIDDKPVDLVFMLLAPAEAGADHLQALGQVSRLMRDATFCAECRQTKNAAALYSLLSREVAAQAA